MSREIEFRGISEKTNEFVYGYLVKLPTVGSIIISQKLNRKKILSDYVEEINIKKNTEGQFTGKLDSNNVKIYEGDIVKIRVSNNEKEAIVNRFRVKNTINLEFINGKVVYIYQQGGFVIEFNENQLNLVSTSFGWGGEQYEVVGNIYKNPELLEN